MVDVKLSAFSHQVWPHVQINARIRGTHTTSLQTTGHFFVALENTIMCVCIAIEYMLSNSQSEDHVWIYVHTVRIFISTISFFISFLTFLSLALSFSVSLPLTQFRQMPELLTGVFCLAYDDFIFVY